jgi:3-oxocholest-4-en-26-oyl-CoA dehydrogenase beta subunit
VDLDLSNRERALRDEARDVLARLAPPEALNRLEQSADGFDPDLWRESVAAGWPGLDSAVELGIVLVEHGRAAAASPLLQAGLAVRAARMAGDRQTESEVVGGRRGVLLIEPNGGASPWLTGQALTAGPITVEWAGHAELFVVATASAGKSTLLVVEPQARNLQVEPAVSFDTERIASVTLAQTPARIGGNLGGSYDLDRLRALAGLLRAAEMLGGAERVLEMTVEHVKMRRQFGKPLGILQAVQHMCADAAMQLEGGRLAVFEALWRVDQGVSFLRDAVIASWFTSQVAEKTTLTASQLHGGLGYVKEYPLHHYVRRAKAQGLRLGSARTQLEAIAVEAFDERPETTVRR